MATDDLRRLAETWLADDPDPAARDEILELLARLPDSADELADRFAGPLTFGTAGLRGRLRAGPNGMNLAVVTRAAAGLIGWLGAQDGRGPLIIGYDARYGSRDFAEQTARVATAAGREALLLPRPLPTPASRPPSRRSARSRRSRWAIPARSSTRRSSRGTWTAPRQPSAPARAT